jgi:hypothetical protein
MLRLNGCGWRSQRGLQKHLDLQTEASNLHPPNAIIQK